VVSNHVQRYWLYCMLRAYFQSSLCLSKILLWNDFWQISGVCSTVFVLRLSSASLSESNFCLQHGLSDAGFFCHICLSYGIVSAALSLCSCVLSYCICLRCSSVYSSAFLRLYSASSISEIFVFVSRWSCTYPCVHNTVFPRLCFAFLVTDIRVFRSLHFGCCALHRYPLCWQPWLSMV
jgi:hypothetical protein